jgi:hypothetical protein
MNLPANITRPRRKNAGRPVEKRAPGFLQYARGRECLFVGRGDCDGKIEAMHLDFAGDKGIGTKCSDRYAVPSCQAHHRRQHNKGWLTFLRDVNLTKNDLMIAAARLWNAWPGRVSWERKLTDG